MQSVSEFIHCCVITNTCSEPLDIRVGLIALLDKDKKGQFTQLSVLVCNKELSMIGLNRFGLYRVHCTDSLKISSGPKLNK